MSDKEDLTQEEFTALRKKLSTYINESNDVVGEVVEIENDQPYSLNKPQR